MELIETLVKCDLQLFWFINQAHTPFLDALFAIFTNLGNAIFLIPALWLILLIKTPVMSKKHAVIFLLVSMAVSGLINSQIKLLVKRPRPVLYVERLEQNNEHLTGQQVHVVGPVHKYRSFPSGHTNTAFAAATALLLLYGTSVWLVYIGALGVAYSRVYLGVHFPLDTLVGAILAVITTILVYKGYVHRIHSFEPKPAKNRPSQKNELTKENV